MIDEALTAVHDHGWYLYMLWEDASGWGATIRDALEGTCEHHASARSHTPEDAIWSAIYRMADETYDNPEPVTAFIDPSVQHANAILSALGMSKKHTPFRLLGGKRQ